LHSNAMPIHRQTLAGRLARSERFELPTLGFEVRCSIQLSYERILIYGIELLDLLISPAGKIRPFHVACVAMNSL
jgi:hypothetical protein